MDETIGRNISLFESHFNLCVLRFSYSLAGCEPLGYMFSNCCFLKKHFLFKAHKSIWSFPSLPIVLSEGSFKSFDTNIFHNNKSVSYYKLPYIGSYSNGTKEKIYELCKTFNRKDNVKIAFSPFKFQDLFSSKDCLPVALKFFVVNKFICAGCLSCYIGETKHHWWTRIKKYLQTDTKSHILQHLIENPNCRDLRDDSCFIIIDHASSSFRLKLKDALCITWLKAVLKTEESCKYHNFGIMEDNYVNSILGFLLPLVY